MVVWKILAPLDTLQAWLAALIPCKHRLCQSGTWSPSDLLRDLHSKELKCDDCPDWASSSVLESPIPDHEKAELLKTLLDLGKADELYDDPWNGLMYLIEPSCFVLAETLLVQDAGFSATRVNQDALVSDCIFPYRPGTEYERYTKPPYQDHLSRAYDVLFTRGNVRKDLPRRCVLHVLTKALIEDTIPEPKAHNRRTRYLDALKIRQQYRLPDLPIDNSALIRILEHVD
ncbi:hypothetical protein LTR85_005068 [Meristemomyces frigidus]|nr:hypothetical protein LTR85_005068 [Meristemomyces frigidus]